MQFHDYMKYIDMGCQMAGIPRYQWNQRSLGKDPHKQRRKAFLILGAICSFYQIIGVFLYWFFYDRKTEDTAAFVAGIGEMCGSLMLTSVGSSNIYALIKNHSQIEAVLEELRALYPGPSERHYRCHHYYKMAIYIMQCEFRFYMIFYTYYNSAPLLMLLWEHQEAGQELSFRTQTNTWFPWRVHGSALGFGLAYLSIVVASCVGVGFSIMTHSLVCIFTFQLKLHYDAMESQLLNLDSRHPESKKQLRILIAYHIRILQIADRVNHILNFNFGSSLVGSTIAICMTSVAVLLLDLASAFKSISGLVAFVLYHFVICYMGTEVTLADYMRYPDMAFRMGFVPRFRWNGRPAEIVSHMKARKVIFVLGTIFLVYQNIGELVHWQLVGRKAEDTASFVAEISEAAGALMLTSIGACNIFALTYHRTEIEEVLTELERLYPRPREMYYRRQHYFDLANRLMKYEFVFYLAFCAYYNGAPLLGLLYEYLMDGMEMRYKLQINTWYPWRTHGSALGYSIGFLCTVLSSIEGVAFSVATHHVLCIVTYNLKLHYDALSEQLLALDSRHPDAHRTLRNLIVYHIQILDVGDKVNRIMNFSFLAALISATVAICMTSVAMLLLDLASAFKYFNGLAAFVVYNFVICYLGTEVTVAKNELGKAVIISYQMRLEDFMMYPDWVCRMALLPRYEWKGRQSSRVNHSLAKRILLMLGLLHLIYHNFGCIMYGYHVDRNFEDPIRYVADLASAGSMLGFTIVGTLNLWKLLYFKPQIEEMLGDFEELFKLAQMDTYRTSMYYEAYTQSIKGLVIAFSLSIVYYDSLPLTLMLWEHFMTESKELSYQIQSSTWYPWQIQGSVFGFSVAFILQTFSCQLLMASLMLNQYLISFCGTQLEIHFDGLARQLEAIDARHPTAKDQLRYLVTYHSYLFKVADKVNRIFNFTFCISLSIATMGMCFLAFSMTMFELGDAIKHLFGLTIFMIYNFTICRDGTQLTLALEDFMMYPDWVGRMALLPRYEWKGRRSSGEERSLTMNILLLLGTLCLVGHNFLIMMYGYRMDGSSKEPLFYLAEWAAVVSMLGFTIVGTLNLWMLLYNKSQIEDIFKDFEELFKYAEGQKDRTQQYYEAYTRYLRNLVVFYSTAIVYYNCLPFILLLWEHFLTESRQLTYRIQSTTWYPWRTKGSVFGFGAAYIQQADSCQFFMVTIVLAQFLVSFFGTQLEIHFDGLARQLEAIDAKSPRAKDQLRSLVVYQRRLFQVADNVNSMFDFTFFVGLSTSTLSMGLLAICMTTLELGPALKFFFGLLIMLIYSFSMCRNGTHLTLAVSRKLA